MSPRFRYYDGDVAAVFGKPAQKRSINPGPNLAPPSVVEPRVRNSIFEFLGRYLQPDSRLAFSNRMPPTLRRRIVTLSLHGQLLAIVRIKCEALKHLQAKKDSRRRLNPA